MKNLESLVKNIKVMLEEENTKIDFSDTVSEIINKRRRFLGSGNQCYHVMYMVTQYLNVQKMLEIGTHQAGSTIVFCQAIVDNGLIPEIHTVDNWSQASYEELAKDNIEKARFSKYITMHNGDSLIKVPEVFKKIGKVDLIFIDGNHDWDYVSKDYNNCKVYSDALLFHDTREGDVPYLKEAKNDGYVIYNFPSRYVEGDGHLIGISLAIK